MKTTPRSMVRRLRSTQRRLKPEPEPEPTVKKFIKIILLSTIKEKMMKVPERFVRLGPKFSDNVTLETPVGFKRSIRIKRTGNEVWFENGWTDFAEAHSLSEGHFLYFHYKGNSSFLVTIFDVSASEIDYPLEKVYVIESDDDEVMEVVEDVQEEEVFNGFQSGGPSGHDDEVMEAIGFHGFETSSRDDSSEGVIDLDELLEMNNLRDNVKSQEIDDDKAEAEDKKSVLTKSMRKLDKDLCGY